MRGRLAGVLFLIAFMSNALAEPRYELPTVVAIFSWAAFGWYLRRSQEALGVSL